MSVSVCMRIHIVHVMFAYSPAGECVGDPITRCIYSSGNVLDHIDGLAQNCSNSIALAMELLQFCNKPSPWICFIPQHRGWAYCCITSSWKTMMYLACILNIATGAAKAPECLALSMFIQYRSFLGGVGGGKTLVVLWYVELIRSLLIT